MSSSGGDDLGSVKRRGNARARTDSRTGKVGKLPCNNANADNNNNTMAPASAPRCASRFSHLVSRCIVATRNVGAVDRVPYSRTLPRGAIDFRVQRAISQQVRNKVHHVRRSCAVCSSRAMKERQEGVEKSGWFIKLTGVCGTKDGEGTGGIEGHGI